MPDLPTSSEAKPYHREDLRRDLLRAGKTYVAEHGHNGLSIRTLAQQVGVSPGAPYHHFPDRRAFLLALAIEGFKDLIARTERLLAGAESAEEKLVGLGLDFFAFADRNPRLLDLMYESELTTPTLDPELVRFQVAGHDVISRLLTESLPGLAVAEIELRGLMVWAGIYGFTTMRKKGILRSYGTNGFAADGSLDALMRRIVHAALAA